ncbi:hypothetical protein THL1_2667 [Pseudomonas sp. TCU-HL1]|nr:hypothetical protein THL1_2667 [Pseudomonas sp. TCU-HL1]
MTTASLPHGAGLGLRRALLPELLAMEAGAVDFLECTPDNWIKVGGRHGDGLARLAERFPLAYQRFGALPTLLERDFNFPPLAELLGEVQQIRVRQQAAIAWPEVRRA